MDRSVRPAPASRPPTLGSYLDDLLRQTRALVAESQHCLEESRALLDALPPRRLGDAPAR